MCDAAPDMLAELKRLHERHGDQSIADVIAKATGKSATDVISVSAGTYLLHAPTEQGPKLTMAGLVRAFKDDPESRYQKLRYATRGQYDGVLSRLEREIGNLAIAEIKPDDVKGWHNGWCANGQIAMAHSLVSHARMMLRYGSTTMHDADCARLIGAMCGMYFKTVKPRKDKITAEQASAIRAMAHKMGRPSLALAQALQFELQLGQRDVIGEWVPKGEPGESDVLTDNEEWVRGLRWSEIDANLIFRSKTGERPETDLRQFPMVMEEIARFQPLPSSGPVLVCEATGIPWVAVEFRRQWRKVADACGIPRTIFNRDSRANRSRPITPPAVVDHNVDRVRKDESGRRLFEKVDALVSKSLRGQIREDVRQNMIRDVLAGKINEADLPKLVRQYATMHYKDYDNRFSTVSLDQPVAGMENQSLVDQISSDHDVWR